MSSACLNLPFQTITFLGKEINHNGNARHKNLDECSRQQPGISHIAYQTTCTGQEAAMPHRRKLLPNSCRDYSPLPPDSTWKPLTASPWLLYQQPARLTGARRRRRGWGPGRLRSRESRVTTQRGQGQRDIPHPPPAPTCPQAPPVPASHWSAASAGTAWQAALSWAGCWWAGM